MSAGPPATKSLPWLLHDFTGRGARRGKPTDPLSYPTVSISACVKYWMSRSNPNCMSLQRSGVHAGKVFPSRRCDRDGARIGWSSLPESVIAHPSRLIAGQAYEELWLKSHESTTMLDQADLRGPWLAGQVNDWSRCTELCELEGCGSTWRVRDTWAGAAVNSSYKIHANSHICSAQPIRTTNKYQFVQQHKADSTKPRSRVSFSAKPLQRDKETRLLTHHRPLAW